MQILTKPIVKGVVLVFVFGLMVFGGWYVFLRDTTSESGGVAGESAFLRSPFTNISLLDSWDGGTKQVFQQKIDGTKALFAEAPEAMGTWIAIGNLQRVFGHPQEAIAAYKHAIEIDPSNLLSYRNIAEVYIVDMQNYEEAAVYYRLALARNFADPTLYLSYGFLLDKNLKKPQDAINVYQDGLKKTQNDRDILLQLVELYRIHGPVEKYEEYKKLFVSLYPRDSAIQTKYVESGR